MYFIQTFLISTQEIFITFPLQPNSRSGTDVCANSFYYYFFLSALREHYCVMYSLRGREESWRQLLLPVSFNFSVAQLLLLFLFLATGLLLSDFCSPHWNWNAGKLLNECDGACADLFSFQCNAAVSGCTSSSHLAYCIISTSAVCVLFDRPAQYED